MKSLTEITNNLMGAVDRYDSLPLDDVLELSEILRTLGVNLSALVTIRDEYYRKFQSVYRNSAAKTNAGKDREAEELVPELDLCRKILRHYGELQKDIRSQISLRKNQDA